MKKLLLFFIAGSVIADTSSQEEKKSSFKFKKSSKTKVLLSIGGTHNIAEDKTDITGEKLANKYQLELVTTKDNKVVLTKAKKETELTSNNFLVSITTLHDIAEFGKFRFGPTFCIDIFSNPLITEGKELTTRLTLSQIEGSLGGYISYEHSEKFSLKFHAGISLFNAEYSIKVSKNKMQDLKDSANNDKIKDKITNLEREQPFTFSENLILRGSGGFIATYKFNDNIAGAFCFKVYLPKIISFDEQSIINDPEVQLKTSIKISAGLTIASED